MLEGRTQMKITEELRKTYKAQGFLPNKDGLHCSARVLTENGVLTAEQLVAIAAAANKFGTGEVSFTARLTVEIPGVAYEDAENIQTFLAASSLSIGGAGPKIRPIVACKGTVCGQGLCDTQGDATKLHKRFYEKYQDTTLPHKFKIAVGGCPNNCVKPDLNDIGLMGQCAIQYDAALCKGCKKCIVTQVCPVHAVHRETGDDHVHLDPSRCIQCGKCAKNCYFHAFTAQKTGYRIYLGGRWGKATRLGTPLSPIFSFEEACDVITNAIQLFRDEGQQKERFGNMIDRIGIENVQKKLGIDKN